MRFQKLSNSACLPSRAGGSPFFTRRQDLITSLLNLQESYLIKTNIYAHRKRKRSLGMKPERRAIQIRRLRKATAASSFAIRAVTWSKTR